MQSIVWSVDGSVGCSRGRDPDKKIIFLPVVNKPIKTKDDLVSSSVNMYLLLLLAMI